MNFTQIAKTSLQTIWKHKSLWLFGFFIAAGGGGAGARSRGGGVGSAAGASTVTGMPDWFWPLMAVAAVVGVVTMVLHVVSEAALIDGARKASAAEAPTVGSGFASGRKHFGRVLGVKLLSAVLFTLVGAVMALPAALGLLGVASTAVAVAATIPLMLIGVPALLSLYFIYVFALRIAVIDEVGTVDALSRARTHLQGRVLDSVKLLLVTFVGQVVGGAAMFVSVLPAAAVGAMVYFAFGLLPAAIVAGVLAVPLAAMVLGAMGAYRSTVWTVGFLEGRAEELS